MLREEDLVSIVRAHFFAGLFAWDAILDCKSFRVAITHEVGAYVCMLTVYIR